MFLCVFTSFNANVLLALIFGHNVASVGSRKGADSVDFVQS